MAGRLAALPTTVLWRLSPGRHRLALIDADGRELESVSFEVRALKGLRDAAATTSVEAF